MKVRALTSFSLGGGRDVHPGTVFDLNDREARLKVRQGWVEPVGSQAPEAPEPESSERKAHPEAESGAMTTQGNPPVVHGDPTGPGGNPAHRGRQGRT